MTVWQHVEFWWSIISGFWVNFTSASVGQVSPNLDLCYGNATVLYDDGFGVYEQYISLELEEAGYSTYNIIRAIDPVIFACYSSIFDYYKVMTIYVSTMSDFQQLLYNFCHNLGNIYDLTEEGLKRGVDWVHNWNDPEFWSRMGFIAGHNMQNLFERPENYFDHNDEIDGERV